MRALETFLPLLPSSARCAVEFRDPGWFEQPLCDDVAALLRERGIALALTESPFVPLSATLPRVGEPTAGFHYVNNTYHGHSPATVRMLYDALGIPHRRPKRIEQPTLFAL